MNMQIGQKTKREATMRPDNSYNTVSTELGRDAEALVVILAVVLYGLDWLWNRRLSLGIFFLLGYWALCPNYTETWTQVEGNAERNGTLVEGGELVVRGVR